MKQTNGIDKSKPIEEQLMDLLDKRYYVEDSMLGGRFQHHKKVVAAIMELTGEHFKKSGGEALKENGI